MLFHVLLSGQTNSRECLVNVTAAIVPEQISVSVDTAARFSLNLYHVSLKKYHCIIQFSKEQTLTVHMVDRRSSMVRGDSLWCRIQLILMCAWQSKHVRQ